jgi:hypothetical protein
MVSACHEVLAGRGPNLSIPVETVGMITGIEQTRDCKQVMTQFAAVPRAVDQADY